MKVNMKHIGEWAFRIGAVTNALIHRLKLSDEEYAELKKPYRE